MPLQAPDDVENLWLVKLKQLVSYLILGMRVCESVTVKTGKAGLGHQAFPFALLVV